jgi:putative DNA primase/helicase
MNEPLGATAAEWFQFDLVLGLGADLLPCVPNSPGVKVAPGSALEGRVGKIPSQFNSNGEAHGLREWQKRPILSNEVANWSRDGRLNLCVRTGPISGVYAFDIDVEDESLVRKICTLIYSETPGTVSDYYLRTRDNSAKILIPFLMEEPCKKRKIKFDKVPGGPAIELLADGQQFVAAGSHSSGARYQWLPELPTRLPVLTLEQVNQLWTALTSRYATASTTGPTTTPSSSTVGEATALASISDSDWTQLIDALRFMMDKVRANDEWSQIGYALLSLQGSRPVEQLWYEFSRKAAGYTEGAPESWWQSHRGAAPRTDYRHIFAMARQRGWGATSPPEVFNPTHDHGPGPTQPEAPANADGALRPDGPDGTDAGRGLDLVHERQIVRLVAKDFSQIIDQLEVLAKPEMYTQGSNLVRLSPGHEDDEIQRSSDQLMLVGITTAYARKRLGEMAHFMKFYPTSGKWNETAPSAEHINALIEQGAWRKLRPLDAIARAPFIRRDGSICNEPGYDRRSRVLLIPSAEFPDVPQNPGHDQARGALGHLRGVFHQFPWASPAAESGFLAHVLSEAGRLAINKCPMFFYNAPSAGTGKTLLQKAASVIVHGTVPALRPWVGDGNEIRKTVYASLLAGDRSLLFDNVPDGFKVRSSELCAAITAENWQDRKLGESESKAVPNRAVFSASGNNINPTGDLFRRSIIIRLDANTERLALRQFEIEDLESYLVRERPTLLVDALTIIRAYHRVAELAGVTMPVALASFEQWSHFVREPLIWLGMPDPVETQRGDGDEDAQTLAAAFSLLVTRFGENRFSGVDIAHGAGGISDANGQLTNALIAAGCKEPNSPHRVGYWLRGNRDKVFGGMKLTAGVHTMMGMQWRFVKVE